VNRCPGRALVKEKVWWRGVEKNKLIYDRCRPVMATYEGCAVCMKVCPAQRYGLKPVMEHYVETGGEILGKGTDNLEGFELRDKGYFGPGKLPKFQRAFFDFPHGTKEEWLFEEFKEKLQSKTKPTSDEVSDFVNELDELLAVGHTTRGDE
jgi:ferredoxin